MNGLDGMEMEVIKMEEIVHRGPNIHWKETGKETAQEWVFWELPSNSRSAHGQHAASRKADRRLTVSHG